jgi:hypothetical protein
MKLATLVTPNLPELAALGGEAAVRAHGPALLVKGGHATGDTIEDRLVTDAGNTVWTHPRIDTRHTHGTGCTLASGIATGLGAGMPLADAVSDAVPTDSDVGKETEGPPVEAEEDRLPDAVKRDSVTVVGSGRLAVADPTLGLRESTDGREETVAEADAWEVVKVLVAVPVADTGVLTVPVDDTVGGTQETDSVAVVDVVAVAVGGGVRHSTAAVLLPEATSAIARATHHPAAAGSRAAVCSVTTQGTPSLCFSRSMALGGMPPLVQFPP